MGVAAWFGPPPLDAALHGSHARDVVGAAAAGVPAAVHRA